MATRFVVKKTTRMTLDHPSAEGSKTPILIFGDEVETLGPTADDGTVPVSVRGRKGRLKASALGTARALEAYFIDVGTGDSTFIVTPGDKKILIDGGLNRRALGFLAWKYRLDERPSGVDIDLLILSHADDDHLLGLTEVVTHPRIRVKRIIHSGIAKFRAEAAATGLGDTTMVAGQRCLTSLHRTGDEIDPSALTSAFGAWIGAIAARKIPCDAVDSTTGTLDLGDPEVLVEVLGPRRVVGTGATSRRLLRYFESSDAKAINGNSVVLRVTHGGVSFLLPGDINAEASAFLLEDESVKHRLSAHVMKAAHHGSDDFAPAFLALVRPQITVISSGDDRDHGHPRASYLGMVGRVSRSEAPLIFSTEIAARFVETKNGHRPTKADMAITDEDTPAADASLTEHRKVFKRSLHGLINVRTDGKALYAMRRVSASYQWEAYGPLAPAP